MEVKVAQIPNLPGTRAFGQNSATRYWPIVILIAPANPVLFPTP
jgi:hypothetical protein